MYTVDIAFSADNDLTAIAEYIALDNPYRAISFTQDLLTKTINVLTEFPWSGKKYKNAFCIPFKRYLIFYDINETDKHVLITHIKNAAQFTAYQDLIN